MILERISALNWWENTNAPWQNYSKIVATVCEFIGYTKLKDLFSNVLFSSVMTLVFLWRQFKIVLTVVLTTRKRCFLFVYFMPPSVIKVSRLVFFFFNEILDVFISKLFSHLIILRFCLCFVLRCSDCWLVNKYRVIFSANHSLARAFLSTACIVFALWLVHTFCLDNTRK